MPSSALGTAIATTKRALTIAQNSPLAFGRIVKGSTTVLIGGRPAARVGDMSGCGAPIVMGMLLVEIGG